VSPGNPRRDTLYHRKLRADIASIGAIADGASRDRSPAYIQSGTCNLVARRQNRYKSFESLHDGITVFQTGRKRISGQVNNKRRAAGLASNLMATTPDYSLSWILPFVRESLRGRSNFSFENYIDGLWRVFETVGVLGIEKNSPLAGYSGTTYNFSQAPNQLRVSAAEALFYLIHSGFIIPGVPTTAPGFPKVGTFYVTSRGLDWASGIQPLPEDFNGYMKLLRELVPKLDSVIEQYISEGLSSFVRGTYFAAAVMVGAAAEKAVYLLADSMLDAFIDVTRQGRLKKLMERRKLNDLFHMTEKTIHDAYTAKMLPYPVFDGATSQLMALIESIKVQRNDAVHPMNATVSAASVRHSFNAFPHALEKLESLRTWFAANPKSV
jgi:hypothetical protein